MCWDRAQRAVQYATRCYALLRAATRPVACRPLPAPVPWASCSVGFTEARVTQVLTSTDVLFIFKSVAFSALKSALASCFSSWLNEFGSSGYALPLAASNTTYVLVPLKHLFRPFLCCALPVCYLLASRYSVTTLEFYNRTLLLQIHILDLQHSSTAKNNQRDIVCCSVL